MVNLLASSLQLFCLALFVCVIYMLNISRSSSVQYKSFKIKYWLPVLTATIAMLFLLQLINLPHLLQPTLPAIRDAHASLRSRCLSASASSDYLSQALHISNRTVVQQHREQQQSVAKQLQMLSHKIMPICNYILFNTGVTIVVVPTLVQLLLLFLYQRFYRSSIAGDAQVRDEVDRQWATLLPILNVIALISLCVSPYFYFVLQPSRIERCIYSSGHWYTFSCTILTFALIIAHLYSYRETCQICERLLKMYTVWCTLYLATSLAVLKDTQLIHHDDMEARDGIVLGCRAFPIFMAAVLAMQLIAYRVIQANKEAAAKQSTTTAATTTTTSPATTTSAPAAPAASAAAAAPVAAPAAKEVKEEMAAASPTTPPPAPALTPSKPVDTSSAAPVPAAPQAPPLAPPMAPPISSGAVPSAPPMGGASSSAPKAPPLAPSPAAAPSAPKAAPAPASAAAIAAGGGASLFTQIVMGRSALKRVSKDEAPKPAASALPKLKPTAPQSALMASLLKIRKAVEPNDDSDDWNTQ